jgi:hypothetical protein
MRHNGKTQTMMKRYFPFGSDHVARTLAAALLLLLSGGRARADLFFPEPVADAGEVRSGTSLVHRFTFINQGTATIEITGARASCGCLKPRLEQRTCGSGERGSLLLEVNTLSQAPGRHEWKAWITYKIGDASYESPLQLHARIVAEITVRPAALTIFAGSVVEHEILLTDLRSTPLSIREVRPSSPHLKSEVVGEYRDESGHQVQKLRLLVTGEYPDGRHEEVVGIYTDDPLYRELRVPVTIVKQGRTRLAATPDQVTLQTPRGQSASSKIVLIRDSQNQQVEIESITSDDPAITCHWAKGPGAMATVKIQIDHGKQSTETLETAVHVETREPTHQTLTIPVTCTMH